ncbi:MAG TPA: 50S ribosomal protein L11 methyltransferase [Nitrospiraceae bacterium]|nr:50S ribosomal protein L11 methyltransferase [Nitrospiraceae bacterium]
MTGQEWVDVRIRTSIDAAELLAMLDDPSVQGSWEDNDTVHVYWPRHSWGSEVFGRLRQVLFALDPDSRSEQAVQVEPLQTQDWNRRWTELVKPIRVGRRLIIRPSWESVQLQPDDIEIGLDPKQAFGTGHHATTSLLLEWLEEIIDGGESVLDVGTGSGILAMAALRFGAAKAVGIDSDPVAIECARGYAQDNHFGTELRLETGDLSKQTTILVPPPDIVLANLDQATLTLCRDHLASYVEHGARLLVSGVLVDHQRELVQTFSSAGMYRTETREREGWVVLEFQAAQSCEGI